jgi:hypothetical protein
MILLVDWNNCRWQLQGLSHLRHQSGKLLLGKIFRAFFLLVFYSNENLSTVIVTKEIKCFLYDTRKDVLYLLFLYLLYYVFTTSKRHVRI